ncbi:MAG TPA: GntR family transcriptional regulator [Vicinamibacteria bacterium]|nr:GntR family transcriptional regulator [Vicinamibacteria bacterium]
MALDIVLNRRGGVPIRDQLVTQLEMKILDGTLAHGQRLPSVRSLARRLKVHHNTVSAAYQDLEEAGHVELQRGSGVFVRRAGTSGLTEARGLDEVIRLALFAALSKGFSGAEIRGAVERWLAAAPPDRLVVVDPSAEMGELLVHELRETLGVPASACTLDEVTRDPARVSGALVLVLPYHLAAVRAAAPGASAEVITLEVQEADRRAVADLPVGSIVLFLSHSPTVLPFASVFLRSLRGDEVLVETRLLSAPREWKRLVRAADLVMTDSLCTDAARKAGARRVREIRVVPEAALMRLREALTIVVPRVEPRHKP